LTQIIKREKEKSYFEILISLKIANSLEGKNARNSIESLLEGDSSSILTFNKTVLDYSNKKRK